MQCQQCGERVKAQAHRCPYCGYDPSKEGRVGRAIVWLTGLLFGLTGIGAVIGIPLLWYYSKLKENAKNRTVASPA